MPKSQEPLEGEALIKEVCRRIRVARSYWEAHNNAACRGERSARWNSTTPSPRPKRRRFRSSCGSGCAIAVKNTLVPIAHRLRAKGDREIVDPRLASRLGQTALRYET